IEVLCDAELSNSSERRRREPYGLAGGQPGRTGANYLIAHGRRRRLPGKVSGPWRPGERLRLETPGGGGFGRAPARRTRSR
ncbi:MAG: hydantoinase B/oxoprolinase family protein, partial [Candidatus Wallbacteria bacterium]|nr:hydantoinase B/oxoprolinase family protein [Candidatus Wallbacteria bacterium]